MRITIALLSGLLAACHCSTPVKVDLVTEHRCRGCDELMASGADTLVLRDVSREAIAGQLDKGHITGFSRSDIRRAIARGVFTLERSKRDTWCVSCGEETVEVKSLVMYRCRECGHTYDTLSTTRAEKRSALGRRRAFTHTRAGGECRQCARKRQAVERAGRPFAQLQAGMSKSRVRSIVGEPHCKHSFPTGLDRWDYWEADKHVNFQDGKVLNVGGLGGLRE